ncbi:MAG: phage holin family protein [Thermoanaerobaculales bacterium]
MANPKEIPQIATELIDMSREYLLQETIEPAKRLGKVAGMGVGGAVVLSIGAFLMAWALYYGLNILFPVGEWWVVLSRFLTALAAAGTAGIIVWRMQSDDLPG